MDILRSIEGRALAVRELPKPSLTMSLDTPSPEIRLPMERPLYTPAAGTTLQSGDITDADDEVDTTLLFQQVYVDPARLGGNVRSALRGRDQVSLRDMVEGRPVEQGLAELVGYPALAEEDIAVLIDEEHEEQIEYVDTAGRPRTVTMPRVSYVRRARTGSAGRAVKP
jgi:hypothetical protein